MNYENIYNALIEKRLQTPIDGYSESHHIIPRCMGGDNDPCNIVDLTAEEHFLAHLLLCKIYPNNIRLVKAAMFMCGGGTHRHNNKVYGWMRRRLSEDMKSNNPNAGGKARLDYIRKHGKAPPQRKPKFTEQSRQKLKKFGKSNPMYQIKPWEHGRATDYTKSVWKQADVLYNHWINNGKPSYSKLYRWHTGNVYSTINDGSISPYMNIYKYFKNGWIPTEDDQWITYKR